jgi:aspartyl-tRNA(Asn)/glutamyl-tRNA(Gln) amidotransferase subunit A
MIAFHSLQMSSLCEAARLLTAGTLTSSALIFNACKRLDTIRDLNVFVTEFKDSALLAAQDCDVRLKAGQGRGILEGVPLAVKDNFCVAGSRTSCASRMLNSFTAPYNATVVERTVSNGGIILGKTNLGELILSFIFSL